MMAVGKEMAVQPKRKPYEAIALLVLGCGALCWWAFTQPKVNADSSIKVNQNRKVDAPPRIDTDTRPPLSYYLQAIRPDLFHYTMVADKAPAPPSMKPVLPPAPVNPFADWVYVGTVLVRGQTYALVQNNQTKEGQYLKVGDLFLGDQVASISDQMLTLKAGGKSEILPKNQNYTLVPLDKSASYLGSGTTATPSTPASKKEAPNNNQTPPTVAPGTLPAPFGMHVLPNGNIQLRNGRVITQQQFQQRRARFMQRRGF